MTTASTDPLENSRDTPRLVWTGEGQHGGHGGRVPSFERHAPSRHLPCAAPRRFRLRRRGPARALPGRARRHRTCTARRTCRRRRGAPTATTSSTPAASTTSWAGRPAHAELVGALPRRRPGPGARHRAEPHGHRRRQPVRGGTCWRTARPAGLRPCFDIDWEGPDDRSAFSVLVPVLGDHYGRVLEAGDLRLVRRGGRFVVRYFEHGCRCRLARSTIWSARRLGGRRRPQLAELADALGALPHARLSDRAAVLERDTSEGGAGARPWPTLRPPTTGRGRGPRRRDRIGQRRPRPARRPARPPELPPGVLADRAARSSTTAGSSTSRSLVGVAGRGPRRLRRCAPADRASSCGTARSTGLRVDHVDGLRDPAVYLAQLAAATGGAYTVVEKILEAGEVLRPAWPVAGTSGYDFLTRVERAVRRRPRVRRSHDELLRRRSPGRRRATRRSCWSPSSR